MSFADYALSTERTPLRTGYYGQYGEIHTDQVDRVATTSMDGLDWLRELPDASSGHISQDKAPVPITVADPIEQSSEPVKKEAMKVNWCLFGALLACCILPGIGYLIYVAWHNWGIDESRSQEDSSGLQRPAVSAPREARAAQRKKAEPIFQPMEEPIAQLTLTDEETIRSFREKKQALKDEAQCIVRAKTQLQDEKSDLEELIPVVKAMSFFERKRAGHPSSKELQKRLDEIPAEIERLQSKAHEVSRELRTYCLQHPEFTRVSNSIRGFPFLIYFEGDHLQQELRWLGCIVGSNDNFNTQFNEKLMSWAGTIDIDPFDGSLAAQAQDVLVQLARNSREPFVVTAEEKRTLYPQTIDRTLQVRFEAGRKLVIEREVQTRDGKRYQWVETIRLGGRGPVASRRVTEIRE